MSPRSWSAVRASACATPGPSWPPRARQHGCGRGPGERGVLVVRVLPDLDPSTWQAVTVSARGRSSRGADEHVEGPPHPRERAAPEPRARPSSTVSAWSSRVGRGGRRTRRRVRRSPLEHRIARLPGGGLARGPGPRRSPPRRRSRPRRAGHLRHDRAACSADPPCRPWSTVAPTTRHPPCAPRRRWARAARASPRHRSRRRRRSGRGRRRPASGAPPGVRRRRPRRLTPASQHPADPGAGSAISCLTAGSRALPDRIEVGHARAVDDPSDEDAPSRYCAIFASRPRSRRSTRSSDPAPCGVC